MKHLFLKQAALALAGTREVQHFDRTAFKTRTIYVTVAPDGQTANLKLDRDQQEHWCSLLGAALSPVPNKWGQQGWTILKLESLDEEEIESLLRLAWSNTASTEKHR